MASISPDKITVTEEVFNAIFELARPQMQVSVPVYAEDGITVIGDFRFDRI